MYYCWDCFSYEDNDKCLCPDGRSIMINDIVLSGKSAELFLEMINNPPEPNQALKDLFHAKDKTDNKD